MCNGSFSLNLEGFYFLLVLFVARWRSSCLQKAPLLCDSGSLSFKPLGLTRDVAAWLSIYLVRLRPWVQSLVPQTTTKREGNREEGERKREGGQERERERKIRKEEATKERKELSPVAMRGKGTYHKVLGL